MKKIYVFLIISLYFMSGKAQIIFETQQQVDSFVQVMDTSIDNHYHFYYDNMLPESERITDLSGFGEDGRMFIRLFYFPVSDIPWFKSFHQGQLYFINMPNLKTFSGLKNIELCIVGINNCPALTFFPPPGFFKHNAELRITNQNMEQFELRFKEAEYKRDGTFNKVFFYNNKIRRLIIEDIKGAAQNIMVTNDSTMRYLEVNSSAFQDIDIKDNPLLDSIIGFNKTETIVGLVTNNPKLTDLCAMRYGWDNHYQSLPQRDKDNFNTSRIGGNGIGASTYEEMMATDCSWLADTFTTVAERVDNSKFLLYPNPVSKGFGSVILDIDNDKTISTLQITNLQGQRVFSSEHITGHSSKVNISDFSVGVYAVQIIDNDGVLFRRKLVVVE